LTRDSLTNLGHYAACFLWPLIGKGVKMCVDSLHVNSVILKLLHIIKYSYYGFYNNY